jgi:hypothetical protein
MTFRNSMLVIVLGSLIILSLSGMRIGKNAHNKLLLADTKPASEQLVLKYEVIRNDKVIGHMESVMREKAGSSEYITESSVSINLIFQLSIFTKVIGIFHDGQLVSGSVLRRVNGSARANATIIFQKDRYVIQEDGERMELHEKIPYTTACLMHVEPAAYKRIFSENYKKFIPIKQLRPHFYELSLPDGNKNFYTYANGICIGAEVNTNLSKAFFRLKK